EPALVDGDRVLGSSSRGMLIARSYYGQTLVQTGRLDRAREVFAEALAHVPADAWSEHKLVAADLARGLGRGGPAQGNYKGALDHCSLARDTTEKDHRGLQDETCIAKSLLELGHAPSALEVLDPIASKAEGRPKDELGPYFFAYARAVWAVRRDA